MINDCFFKVSYNAGLSPVDLAIAGGPYIYVGFRLKGTLNLLGYEIRAEVRIGDMVSARTNIV